MSLITKYGSLYGQIPQHTGRVFYVSPGATYTLDGRTFSASDNNDGQSPERALRTVNQAVTNAAANSGDVILLLEGTHTVTATQRLNKAGLTLWGVASGHKQINRLQPRTILAATGTSIPLLSIESNNTEVGYLDLRPTTSFSAVIFSTSGTTAIDGVYIHDCHFDLETPAVELGTTGIDLGYRSTTLTLEGDSTAKNGNGIQGAAPGTLTSIVVEDCVFQSDGAQGTGITWATAFGVVRGCQFWSSAGTWATPFQVATASDNLLIDGCIWNTTATMSLAIDGALADVAGGCTVTRCYFNISSASTSLNADAIRGFGATEVVVFDSFAGSNANGTASDTSISRMTG